MKYPNLYSHFFKLIYIYIYIYIYMGGLFVCVFVYVRVWWGLLGQPFFVNIYFIKHYRHPSLTHFCIYPFESPHWFYGIQRELVNETLKINSSPSTLCPIYSYHYGCVYCKRDVNFACTSIPSKCWAFIIHTGEFLKGLFLNLVQLVAGESIAI